MPHLTAGSESERKLTSARILLPEHNIMAEHERPVVAYLGPEASYTHQVGLEISAHFFVLCREAVLPFAINLGIPKRQASQARNFHSCSHLT